MPDDYYKILGFCCFIKDALLAFYNGEGAYEHRDRHLLRYIDGINANEFTYQHRLEPIQRANIDPTLLYARSLLLQFNRAIHYSNLLIYQNLQTGNVWVDVTQFTPYGPNYNPTELDPSFWRFGEETEPALVKKPGLAPIPQNPIRQIMICKK